MIEELIREIRSLDLLTTSLEGDDWCIAVDETLQRTGDLTEHLKTVLASISASAELASKGRVV
jgi:hypothetical protein